MSGHTAGPWTEVPQDGAGPMIAHRFETGKQMNPTGLRLICHMLERRASFSEDQANARLIAAAPELLAALENAWDRMDRARSLLITETSPWKMLDTSLDRAALAKVQS